MHDDRSGDWQGLSSPTQRPRYAAIAQMLSKHMRGQTLLDVGCGEGVLASFVTSCRYAGIEPSALAAARARERGINVEQAFAENHTAAEGARYDAIVFNEMLYYAHDPIALLARYAKFLAPEGIIIISIYLKPGGTPWRARIRHWLDRRRPMSNCHCAEMVRRFSAQAGWAILENRKVSIPETIPAREWELWAFRPVRKEVGV